MTTIGDLLIGAATRIARADARVLLAHATGKSKEFFIMHPEFEPDAKTVLAFKEAVDRVAQGCPVPYVTGRQSFWGRDFTVTPDVLIPRPDTETIVELALGQCPCARSILDMGTGSGIIAVSLALETPQAEVWACDVSPKALDVAKKNASDLNAKNVRFALSDWFSAFAGRTFDLIVSNPPYIEPDDKHLAALTFEPIGALTDGVDGLSDIRTIVSNAKAHLNEGGALMLEHGYNQGDAVRKIFQAEGFANPQTVKDLGGNDRVTWARL